MPTAVLLEWGRRRLGAMTVGARSCSLVPSATMCSPLRSLLACRHRCLRLSSAAPLLCSAGRSGSSASPLLLAWLGGRGQARRRLRPSCASPPPLLAPLGGRGQERRRLRPSCVSPQMPDPLGGRGRARAACRRCLLRLCRSCAPGL